jgi:hypothetical protein
MMKYKYLFIMLVLLSTSCVGAGPSIATTTTVPTEPSPTSAPTDTPHLIVTATLPPATDTPAPVTSTSLPTVVSSGSGGNQPPYVDNRSTGSDLMVSFVNAINRKEYVRAYSYWQSGAAQLAPYDQFAQGYANTASVQLTIGTVTAGVGAGQLYYSVPVVLISTLTNGSQQTFVGCYVMHLGQPANYGAPPFQHMDIQSATASQVANGSDTSALLTNACQASGMSGSPLPPQPTYAPDDISAQRYLDDMSDPVEVLRSYFNAINRKEDVRAYTYWEPAAATAQLPAYDQFAQGYQNTASVQLTTGQVTSDAGAGQIYYSVPVTLLSKTTSGSTQTFVGCYKLHLAQPLNYGAPPFQPLSIISASVKQVASGSDTASLMSQACQ